MSQMTVEISNWDEFERAIADPELVHDPAVAGLQLLATTFETDMRPVIPVKTGAMLASVSTVLETDRKWPRAIVSVNDPGAKAVNFGRKGPKPPRMAGRFFTRAAWYRVKSMLPEVAQRIGRTILMRIAR